MNLTKPLLLVASLAVAAGCSNKKALDGHVDLLRAVVERNDYAAFKTMAHPALPPELPPRQLARASGALAKLGAYKGRKMTGISVQTSGSSGQYRLLYEKGEVELKITVAAGKLTAFNLSGPDFVKALRAAEQARLSEFKVMRFTFLDGPGGKPKQTAVYRHGEPVAFRLVLQGLGKRGGALDFRVGLKVVADEEVVLHQPEFLSKKLPIKADAPPVATVNGKLTLPRPGSYKLRFTIEDRVSSRSLQHAQVLAVEPAAKR